MLHVIGIGPGRPEWLPPAIHDIVKRCDVIFGGSRALKLFPRLPSHQHCLTGDLECSIELMRSLLKEKKTVGVLVSGDPGFYSFLPMLQREFPNEEIVISPGLSSLQFAFAKAGLPWQDATFVSVHGREITSLPRTIYRPLAVLTGGQNTPQKVAQLLLERGINPIISVGNALAYPDEYWETTDAQGLARNPRNLQNAILIIYPVPGQPIGKETVRIGIPDREFIRGEVPMTKAEIRVQVLAKAQISLYDHVLDVGAGTGSISIEAATIASEGLVYAVENDPEAQALIRANQRKFAVPNLRLIPGTAPDVFSQIPPVDVCIIGGSKGRLPDILERVPLVEGGRLVMTAVTLENACKGLELLKLKKYQDVEVLSIQATRWTEMNKLHMAQSLNQVFIISGRKGVTT